MGCSSVAQLLLEQQVHTNRSSRCSISRGVIGGIVITCLAREADLPSSPWGKVPQRRRAWSGAPPPHRPARSAAASALIQDGPAVRRACGRWLSAALVVNGPFTGRWFGGVVRAAADSLPQLRMLSHLGGELLRQFTDLLLLSLELSLLIQVELLGQGSPRQSLSFGNASRGHDHLGHSLLEIHVEIRAQSRVQ